MLMVGSAQASIIAVCPSGCDYTSIQIAVYAAKANDTIEVHSGIYNESVVLTKNIMFNGVDTGRGKPIVNGDLYTNGFRMALSGLTFQSIFSGVPDAKNMTPIATSYRIGKAFGNPASSKTIASIDQIQKNNSTTRRPNLPFRGFREGAKFYKNLLEFNPPEVN